MNIVCIVGRLTKDVELRTTESGKPCVRTSVAIGNGKDENGNDRQADFPTVYIYEKQAENVTKYCKKGSMVAIAGKIKTRSWDKEDGTKGYETYISGNRVTFLDTKKEGTPLPEPEYSSQNSTQTEITEADPFAEFGAEIQLSDDDLPF